MRMIRKYITRPTCVFYIGLILIKELTSACDLAAVNGCMEILSRNSQTTMVTDGISAIPTIEQLKKLCGALDEFKRCYTPKAAECRRDMVFSMTFGTIENTLEYLCVEGYTDILEHATCWNQTAVIKGSTRCQQIQNTMINTLQSHQMAGLLNTTTMRIKWCEVLQNTTSCMRQTVESKCGPEPGCIMHAMMSKALKGLSGLMKCPAPTPCNLHSDGTIHVQEDEHKYHTNATDKTPHSHGETDSAVTGEGRATPENNENGNGAMATIQPNILQPLAFVAVLMLYIPLL